MCPMRSNNLTIVWSDQGRLLCKRAELSRTKGGARFQIVLSLTPRICRVGTSDSLSAIRSSPALDTVRSFLCCAAARLYVGGGPTSAAAPQPSQPLQRPWQRPDVARPRGGALRAAGRGRRPPAGARVGGYNDMLITMTIIIIISIAISINPNHCV